MSDSDLFATRSDWLVKVPRLPVGGTLTIHPLDGLTVDAVEKALAAQGWFGTRFSSQRFSDGVATGQHNLDVRQHGTKIFIGRRY